MSCESLQGPAAPLLLLRMLSLLPLGGGSAAQELRAGYGQYLLHLASALEDAVKREPAGLSAQASGTASGGGRGGGYFLL